MTGRINFTPEARQQLHHLDEWIADKASADTAQRFVAANVDDWPLPSALMPR